MTALDLEEARRLAKELTVWARDYATTDYTDEMASKSAVALLFLVAEVERLQALVNTPTLHSFRDGVVLEAAHQRARWGAEHDAGKAPADWFWLVGYLAGKALHAQTSGNTDKALHHTISTAAALANWHAAITGEHTAMRPGIDPAAHGVAG